LIAEAPAYARSVLEKFTVALHEAFIQGVARPSLEIHRSEFDREAPIVVKLRAADHALAPAVFDAFTRQK
jgi:hypothetical protein